MSRRVSRRAALGVLGAGFAALAGATARPSRCAAITGSRRTSCGDVVSLRGPDSVAVDGSNPQFVATNDADTSVTVNTADWGVYRHDGDWEQVASGPGGRPTTLAPGERTAWVVIDEHGDEDDHEAVTTTDSTQTRYVGPVAFAPGEYAFAVGGRRDGDPVEAVARFAVE